MKEYLKLAIIQPSTDDSVAWNLHNPRYPFMDISEAARTWHQIHIALSQYESMVESAKPDIVVIPELVVAKQYERQLKKIARNIGSIIIAGLDF